MTFYIASVTGNVDPFDNRQFASDLKYLNVLNEYFNESSKSDEIAKAIHVEKSNKKLKFLKHSDLVAEALNTENLDSYQIFV
jgi:hypothetical protein